MTAESIAKSLDGVKAGSQWMAKCPAHEDGKASLALRDDAGKVLVRCHANCAQADVIAALKARGLWESSAKDYDDPIAFDYRDANGTLRYQVIRKSGKKFLQRRPGSIPGTWHWGLDGVEPLPFQLPQITAANEVAVVEGERDAINLTRAGWVASCNSGGAGNFRRELAPYFTGKRIAIFPDNDEPGRKHATSVARILAPTAASVRIVEIPGLPPKGDVSDFLENGGTLEELTRFYAEAPNWTPAAQPDSNKSVEDLTLVSRTRKAPRIPRADLSDIHVNNRQLRDVSTDALLALQAANAPPVVFVRSGTMVSLIVNEKGRTVITEMSESRLRGRMTRCSDFVRLNREGDRLEVSPPIDIVKDILALAPADWNFPALEGVVEVPVLRPDGTILDQPGYDAATSLFYAPDPGLRIPAIPDRPTADDVDAARELVLSIFADFPFVDGASYSNAVGALITPQTIPAIDASTPMALADATAAGTGKSLLADVVAIVATGRPADMMSAPRDPDEWRKQITTALLDGSSVVVIDNLTTRLDSPELCKALTERSHADRLMKTQIRIAVPVKCAWICTGNNIQLGGDMPRRCYRIRMDAQTSRPFLRQGFTHADLKGWVTIHRGQIIAAVLTLCRAWFVAGKPKPKCRPLGSFENWTLVVGGILQHAGIAGFLENSAEMYAQADADSTQWEAFLEALDSAFYSEAFIVATVQQKIGETHWDTETRTNEPTPSAANLRAALPDSIVEAMDKPGLFTRRLGRQLAAMEGRRFGDRQWHVRRCAISHHAQSWEVRNEEYKTQPEVGS